MKENEHFSAKWICFTIISLDIFTNKNCQQNKCDKKSNIGTLYYMYSKYDTMSDIKINIIKDLFYGNI